MIWKRHIKIHGYDVKTEILLESDNLDEIRMKGIYYSKLWNVVESKEFANLKEEAGDGGWDLVNSNSKVLEGRKIRMLTNNPFKDKKHSNKSLVKIREARSKQIILPHTTETKEKIRSSLTGHTVSNETRLKISLALKGKSPAEKVLLRMNSKVTCPHCNKIGNPAIMTRWHFDNCRKKT
jgi:hypothetical protein